MGVGASIFPANTRFSSSTASFKSPKLSLYRVLVALFLRRASHCNNANNVAALLSLTSRMNFIITKIQILFYYPLQTIL